MKILVTGGAGFIGSHIVKKLSERGDKPVIVDNFNNYYDPLLKKDRVQQFLSECKFTVYTGDICDKKLMNQVFKKEKIDKVIHLAAMAGVRNSIKDPLLYQRINVLGTTGLLELSVKHKIKSFVYASSSSVYGGNKKTPFSENDNVNNPISPYAASKKSTELIAHVFNHLYGLPVIGLRYFTVYGPWGRPDMALFKFTRNILKNKPIEVYNYGKMTRNFTYIDDVVSGTLIALDADLKYEILNIGGDREEKLTSFIKIIENCLKIKARQKLLPMQPGEVPNTIADIRKIKKLGWEPATKIEQGIKNFIEWYQSYYG
ncbi:GDP-mannose 4,6-dehydratase [Patescibacteria group bacterium]|nr:GDP-mannose 4,6-dehydratase [Patescibacteria group bacterium]